MDMHFKSVSKEIIMIVHAHRLEHEHKNLTEAFECIVHENEYRSQLTPHSAAAKVRGMTLTKDARKI